jgi:hypothetical protein
VTSAFGFGVEGDGLTEAKIGGILSNTHQ